MTELGWRDIASAPKDGTSLLLYGPNIGVLIGEWEVKFGYAEVTGWHSHAESGVFSIGAVTHWMPLPEPPKSDALPSLAAQRRQVRRDEAALHDAMNRAGMERSGWKPAD